MLEEKPGPCKPLRTRSCQHWSSHLGLYFPQLSRLRALFALLFSRTNCELQRLHQPMPLPTRHDIPPKSRTVRHPLRHMPPDHGIGPPLSIRCSHLQVFPELVALHTFPAQHARLLQPARHLAQTPPPLALLPTLGLARRHRRPGKHGKVHVGQLLRPRVLARLASFFQPLDCQIHLRPTRRQQWNSKVESSGQLWRCLHFRGPMA